MEDLSRTLTLVGIITLLFLCVLLIEPRYTDLTWIEIDVYFQRVVSE